MSVLSLEGITKLVVYGVPAVLILLGVLFCVNGIALELATKNTEMKTKGIWLLAIGVILYIVESALAVYDRFRPRTRVVTERALAVCRRLVLVRRNLKWCDVVFLLHTLRSWEGFSIY